MQELKDQLNDLQDKFNEARQDQIAVQIYKKKLEDFE